MSINKRTCPLGCGSELELYESRFHIEQECPKREVQCFQCNENIEAGSRDKHESQCRMRPLQCGSTLVPCVQVYYKWFASTESSIDDSSNVLQLCACKKHQSHPLIWAAKNNDVQLIQVFFERIGTTIFSFQTSSGDTVITKASECGNDNIITLLADLTYDKYGDVNRFEEAINFETCRGKTALIEAAKQNRQPTVELLCSLHANVNYKTETHRRSALDWATSYNCTDTIETLNLNLKIQATIEVLFVEILRGDLLSVKRILKSGEPFRFNHVIELRNKLDILCSNVCSIEKTKNESRTALNKEQNELKHAKAISNKVQTQHREQNQKIDEITESIRNIESDVQRMFRFAAVSLKEQWNTESFKTFINPNKPSKAALDTAKALCVFFNLRVSESNQFSMTESELNGHWVSSRDFLCASQFYHTIRHFDLSRRVQCEELEQLVPILIDNVNPFHISLNHWILTCCKCLRSNAHVKELRENQNQIQSQIDNNELLRERKIQATVFLESKVSAIKQQIETAEKMMEDTLATINQIQNNLHCARLVRHIGRTGHTLLSWAAATGQSNIVKYLIGNGSLTFGYGEDSLHLCASIIQRQYRFTRETTPASTFTRQAKEIINIIGIKALRSRLKRVKASFRVPFFEAIFNNHAHIYDVLSNTGCTTFQICRESFLNPLPMIPYKIRSQNCGNFTYREITMEESARKGSSELHCKLWNERWIPLSSSNTYRYCIGKVKEIRDNLNTAHSISSMKKAQCRLMRQRRIDLEKWSTLMKEKIDNADFKGILECVRHGVSFDYETADGITPLIRAAMADASLHTKYLEDRGKCSPIQFLLDRTDFCPSIGMVSSLGDSALSIASRLNNVLNISLLLERGADINQHVGKGETPLIAAAKNGCYEAVQLLLDEGSDATLQAHDGSNAIENAQIHNHKKVEELLMRYSRGYFGRAKAFSKKYSRNQYYCRWGCGLVDITMTLKEHEETCLMRIVQCSYCNIQGIQACERIHHENKDCPQKPIPCKLCTKQITSENINIHMMHECPKRNTKCSMCCQEMRADNLPRHEQSRCRQRPIKCTNVGCRDYIPSEQMSKHMHYECKMRSVLCRQCGTHIIAKDRHLHEQSDCLTLQVKCQDKAKTVNKSSTQLMLCKNFKLGCKWTGLESSLDHHLKNLCQYAFIHGCPLRCGRFLQKVNIKRHTNFECQKRLLRCTQCGVEVMAAIKHTHDKYECNP